MAATASLPEFKIDLGDGMSLYLATKQQKGAARYVVNEIFRKRRYEHPGFEIRPTDADLSWQVAVSEQPPSSVQGTVWPADAVISGTVVELYLGLWNRHDPLYVEGRQDVIEQWRRGVRVSW